MPDKDGIFQLFWAQGPERSCLSSDSHSSSTKSWLKHGTGTSCAPLNPCHGCMEGLGNGDGETQSSQGSSPSPFPAHALLGLLGKLELTPRAEPGSGAATSPACQGRANRSLLHPKQTPQFPGIFQKVGDSLGDSFNHQLHRRRPSLGLHPLQMSLFPTRNFAYFCYQNC